MTSIAVLMVATCLLSTIPAANATDSYEPNDYYYEAWPISEGYYSNLDVVNSDNDYYSINVPYRNTIEVYITFLDSIADIDLYLKSTSDETITSSTSTSDNEDVTYTNRDYQSGRTVLIKVYSLGSTVNDYTMEITITGTSGPTVPGYDLFIMMGLLGLVSSILVTKYLRKRK